MRIDDAKQFLSGKHLRFEDANLLWTELKFGNQISLARRVLEFVRTGKNLLDRPSPDSKTRLCQQHAELTSKDPELGASMRHDKALEILGEMFDLNNSTLDGDAETLGIGGGILKRRWMDLGQYEDLQRAAEYYRRGIPKQVDDDGYAHINAAFMLDLLAHASESRLADQNQATLIRELIIRDLLPLDKVADDKKWWNAATRAEAFFGLKRYRESADAIKAVTNRPPIWQLQSTVHQIATLAHLQEQQPLENPDIHAVFNALLPGTVGGASRPSSGKVGLALSGGGFRAAYYHLGVLARLAELDMLRHIDVLSCVSGGSIVGACYWLMLRKLLVAKAPLSQADYAQLIRDLIDHFKNAVAQNLRGQVQPSKAGVAWRFLKGEKGALDTEKTADALEQFFYGPLWDGETPPYMHDLAFTPIDHDPKLTGDKEFNPTKHNWLRVDKVPMLIINATTVNTGHAWQFTPTWMGESPWSTHPSADSVPRLEWHYYAPESNWQMKLGRAVAASACVPGIFEPLRIDDAYEGIQVQLIDGGVHDNQGTVGLMAQNCNYLIVSDAAGQLLMEPAPKPGLPGLASYAIRAMDTLMERVRLANYADLAARVRTKLVRGMIFLHMKEGLDADPVRLKFSNEAYDVRRAPLSPSGVRKDFQKVLSELRTDLDGFTDDEANALMACGYKMGAAAVERDGKPFQSLFGATVNVDWPFQGLLSELESTETSTPRRKDLLRSLSRGSDRNI
jgi:predicted acylesterase/phospholipase RssA